MTQLFHAVGCNTAIAMIFALTAVAGCVRVQPTAPPPSRSADE